MKKLTPQNVFVIKLRKYASPYYLKLWHEKNNHIGHLKHIEAGKRHFEFFIKLYEHVTKTKYDDLFFEYAFSMADCAKEILESDYQILQFEGEAYTTYVFDKDNSELISFFMDNITEIPYKIMKRSRYWMWYDKPQTTYLRDLFRLDPERKAELLKIKKK